MVNYKEIDIYKLKWEIDEAIAEVCIQIIQEPLLYFSEADIQMLMVEELRKINSLSKLYPTSVHKGKDSKSLYSTSLVHREYGGGDGSRIDIVIFDLEDVKKINDVNLQIGKNYLNPLFALELGTEKTTNIEKHLKNDIEKLRKRVKQTGYVIHIYKDVTQARSGTKSRDDTEEKIKNQFKNVFGQDSNKKIKTLGILIRTYRNQSKMWGKCEIYNNNEWIKKNINNKSELKNIILDRLKYEKTHYQ